MLGQNEWSTSAWAEFTRANNDIKYFLIQSQKIYEDGIAAQINTNLKLFHSYIKHQKLSPPTIGPLQLQDDSLSDDPIIMTELFLQRFASVFRNDAIHNPSPNQICNNNIEPLVITPESIELVLSSLTLILVWEVMACTPDC